MKVSKKTLSYLFIFIVIAVVIFLFTQHQPFNVESFNSTSANSAFGNVLFWTIFYIVVIPLSIQVILIVVNFFTVISGQRSAYGTTYGGAKNRTTK